MTNEQRGEADTAWRGRIELELADIRSDLRAVRENNLMIQASLGKVSWNNLVIYIGAVALIGGAGLSPLYQSVSRIETGLKEHRAVPWHNGAGEWLNRLEANIDRAEQLEAGRKK